MRIRKAGSRPEWTKLAVFVGAWRTGSSRVAGVGGVWGSFYPRVQDREHEHCRLLSHRVVDCFMGSFNTVVVIANPSARSGRNGRVLASLAHAVEAAFPGVVFRVTERPGHARDIAAETGSSADLVLACGGDGTVHEVAEGLVSSGSTVPMGVLGMGSGNDFARALHMPSSWPAALDSLVDARTEAVDTGRLTWQEAGSLHDGFFVNALGIGFDAHSAVIAPKYKGYPFDLGYTLAILHALRTWESGHAVVRDGTNQGAILYRGRLMFVTVGNASDSGGGYTVNPGALIADGYLDPCIVEGISALRCMMLLPRVRSGRHIKMKEVRYQRARSLHIETDDGLPIHADGEILSTEARDIQVDINPGSLHVAVPRNAPRFS